MTTKRMFAVGRRDRKATTVVVLRRISVPIVGPWTLTGIIAVD